MDLDIIRVKAQGKYRINRGHPWVFSNEIIHDKNISPGEIVKVNDNHDHFLGWGFYHPKSLISLRLFNTKKILPFADYFQQALKKALDNRVFFYGQNKNIRFIHADSDGLPGLIVDGYNDYLSLQINSMGVFKRKNEITDILVKSLNPKGVYLSTDESHASLEGFELTPGFVYGPPPTSSIEIACNGLSFQIDFKESQKTGFFYDQRENREQLRRFNLEGKKVLDLFCYHGAWGMKAMSLKAGSTVFVDSSRDALDRVESNILLNSLGSRYKTVKSRALDFLKNDTESYDLIICDPPAFIKKKSQVKSGLQGYYHVNELAIEKLAPGGIFVTCSCSHHLKEEKLFEIIQSISVKKGYRCQFLFRGNQAFDHPYYLQFPESQYLKCLYCRIYKN